jgi:hypothetical protein
VRRFIWNNVEPQRLLLWFVEADMDAVVALIDMRDNEPHQRRYY